MRKLKQSYDERKRKFIQSKILKVSDNKDPFFLLLYLLINLDVEKWGLEVPLILIRQAQILNLY